MAAMIHSKFSKLRKGITASMWNIGTCHEVYPVPYFLVTKCWKGNTKQVNATPQDPTDLFVVSHHSPGTGGSPCQARGCGERRLLTGAPRTGKNPAKRLN